ncbi:MAG: hypothetical protein OXT67_03330 [Zetaproteobacteria bacterium]|nr:hypothetical protein [Zetaproteobacteria bacterium]
MKTKLFLTAAMCLGIVSCGEEETELVTVSAVKFQLSSADITSDTTDDNTCKAYQVILSPAPDEAVDVKFTTSSGTVYSDSSCSTSATTIQSAAGATTLDFYYKNTSTGTDSIKAEAGDVNATLEVTSNYAILGSWVTSCTQQSSSTWYTATYNFSSNTAWYYTFKVYSDSSCSTLVQSADLGKDDSRSVYEVGDFVDGYTNVRKYKLVGRTNSETDTYTTTLSYSKVDGSTLYIVGHGSDDSNSYPSTFATTDSTDGSYFLIKATKVE